MDRLLLFEFIHADSDTFGRASPGLRSEGRAMLEALLTDATALSNCEVTVLLCEPALATLNGLSPAIAVRICSNHGNPLDELTTAALDSDFVLPIAPERDGLLLRVAQTLHPLPCTTLLPSLSTVETCSDKLKTWTAFNSSEIPMVDCSSCGSESAAAPCAEPLVVFKPKDGAGCDGILRGQLPHLVDSRNYICQPWIPGRSLSLGVLSGPGGVHIFPVAEQEIVWYANEPRYIGGSIPANIPQDAETRVTKIARNVLRQIGHFRGYLGMDFLLSETDGTVYLNEINPRLCTSYVGYRQLFRINPLEFLLSNIAGSELMATCAPITFRADGTTQHT